ncbi:MAG: hypothetical protein RKO24_14670 [Candidatus Competibacter sp.]|nr:hypothetical protein [Candidatus Competibacter sp.]
MIRQPVDNQAISNPILNHNNTAAPFGAPLFEENPHVRQDP